MSENRLYSIDHLRTTSIILMLFIHTILPYASFSYLSNENYVLSTWPVVQTGQQSQMVSIIALFIDVFNMSLLLCIAGFFSAITIAKTGWFDFLKGRFLRLGLPFLIVVTFYTPLASYVPYRLTGHTEGYLYFWKHVFFSNHWYAYTSWFIWVLLSFSIVFVLYRALRVRQFDVSKHFGSFWVLKTVALSFLCYIILAGKPHMITHLFGPLWLQINRVLLYFWIFSVGALLGAGWCKYPEMVSKKSNVAKFWWVYLCIATGLYAVLFYYLYYGPPIEFQVIDYIKKIRTLNELKPYEAILKVWLVYNLLYPIVCTLMVVGLLGLYIRFLNIYSVKLEYLAKHTYAISLLHFPIVVWLQYALLGINLNVSVKIALIFTLTFCASFILAIGLRKIPGVRHVI